MPRDVVFVPGLPGSKLMRVGPQGGLEGIFPSATDQILDTPDPGVFGPDEVPQTPDPGYRSRPGEVVAGEPIRSVRFLFFDLKQAHGLERILVDRCGLREDQIHAVGWDWRRPVDDLRAREDLRAAILGAPSGSVLVVHSTGGLVARSLLRAEPSLCSRLHAVVALGVPWGGTLKSMEALLRRAGGVSASAATAQRVMARSWAAADLLPRPEAGLTVDGNGAPFDLFPSADWVPGSATLRADVAKRLARSRSELGGHDVAWDLPAPLHNVAGFGIETLVRARLVGGGATVELDVDGHGAPLDFEDRCAGDGTVPHRSAAAIGGPGEVTHWHVPIGAYRGMWTQRHSAIWSNPGCERLLRHVVAGAAPEPWIEIALHTSAYSPSSAIRVRYALAGPDGGARQGSLRVLSPSPSGPRAPIPTDTRGWGARVFPRSDFQLVGGGDRRRVVIAVDGPDGSSEVFAVVPR